MLKRSISVIIFSLVSSHLFAFGDDSTAVVKKKSSIVYFKEDCEDFNLDNYTDVDTTLNDFHYYAGGLQDYFQSLGTTGSPNKSLLYHIADGTGFGLGINAFSPYLLNQQKVDYYNVRRPYTKLHYIMGSNEEQFINVLHTQNISKQFNAGIDFTKSDAQELKTSQTSLLLHNNYQSKNKRYVFLSNFMYDQIGVKESGGLLNKEVLAYNDSLGILGSDVTLSNADNHFRRKSAYLKHFMNFGNKKKILPKGDTIPRFEIIPASRISHTFFYSDQYYRYIDRAPDSLFYSTLFVYNNTLRLYDLIHLTKFENRLAWETLPIKHQGDSTVPRLLNAGVHLKHQYLDYWQDTVSSAYRDYFAGGNISIGNSSGMRFFAEGEYVFAGNDEGDYSAAAGVTYNSGNWYARLKGNYLLIGADFLQGTYSSSHFDWSYDLKKVNPMAAELEFGSKKYHFYIKPYYAHINRYIYFDNNSLPKQLNNAVDVFRISAGKNFRFKNLYLKADVHYQQRTLGAAINLPQWMTFSSIYYENFAFQKKLLVRIGADVFYNTAFFADAWMPLTRQFYLQSEQKTGDKPYVDAWIAVRIKRARIYFKASNVNVSTAGYDYNMTPYYPMQEMSFRFGVDWVFFN